MFISTPKSENEKKLNKLMMTFKIPMHIEREDRIERARMIKVVFVIILGRAGASYIPFGFFMGGERNVTRREVQ
jgi:hypothetical protein